MAPFGITTTSTEQVHNLIYESLVDWDDKLNIVPALATSWEIKNNKTYVFHLRRGVTFHSGKPFTADDVKYSFETQAKPPAPGSVTSFLPKIATIDVIDPYTVQFTMSQSDGTVLGYCAWLAYSFIVPKNFYTTNDAGKTADGTGRFKLDTYVPNDHVALSRHQKYWDPQYPYLDTLTLKVLPDMQSRVTALNSKTIDGAEINSDTALTLKNNPDIQILQGASAAFREIEISIKGGKPWDDVRVRQAINFAIDRQKIIDNVYGGNASFSSKIPPSYGSWPISQSDLKSKYQTFDLNRAKALMKEAGHEAGFSVTLQAISSPADYTQIAEVIKEQLKQININVTVQPMEIGTFAQHNTAGTFDWQSTGRGMRGDPSGYFRDFDPTGSIYKAWYAGGYKNDQMTALINQGLAESDTTKRMAIYTQLQEIVLTEWPTMPLVAVTTFEAVRKRVNGMTVSVDGTYRGLRETWVS
jgi:peptide/nickel transport system substrate-binding protein